MKIKDFLVDLDRQKVRDYLINAGILSYKCFSYQEYYRVYCSLKDAEQQFDRKKNKNQCVEETARHCKVSVRIVWNAIKLMEAEIPV